MRNLLFFSLLLIFVISYFSSKMKSHASTLHLILPWAAYDDEKEGVCQETRSAAAIPKNKNSSSSIQKQEDKKKKRYHHHRQSAFKRCLEPQAEWAAPYVSGWAEATQHLEDQHQQLDIFVVETLLMNGTHSTHTPYSVLPPHSTHTHTHTHTLFSSHCSDSRPNLFRLTVLGNPLQTEQTQLSPGH